MEIPSWDKYFMTMAYVVSKRSKDQSTKAGSVVVGGDHEILSTGYNSFPRGMQDDLPERQERPLKYKYFEHAERNAVYLAAKQGAKLAGATMYVNIMPCCDCARAIIQSGINEIIIHKQGQAAFVHSRGDSNQEWDQDHAMVVDMLTEACVNVRWYDGILEEDVHGHFTGKRYRFFERLSSGHGIAGPKYIDFELS